ncbi:MAG: S-layer homology domain-containing protein, partial [Candidatus Gracilibacteria bacterium]
MKKILILVTAFVLLFTGISVGYASSPASSTALVQLPAPLIAPFKDVKTTDYFAPYVDALKAEGILGGYLNGTFKPSGSLNRAEFAT